MTPRWLLVAAMRELAALSDGALLDAANRARHRGDHLAANIFMHVLAARAS